MASAASKFVTRHGVTLKRTLPLSVHPRWIMSHCTFWPGKTFFYPIGNTPPVCLSQNLAPEEKADVLFLGCGDPRSILFTVYATGLISETREFRLDLVDHVYSPLTSSRI